MNADERGYGLGVLSRKPGSQEFRFGILSDLIEVERLDPKTL
jgi:hypothetical protein